MKDSKQLKADNDIVMNECKSMLAEIAKYKLTEPQNYFLLMIQKYFLDNIKPYFTLTEHTPQELKEVNIITTDYKDKLTDFLQEIKRNK